MTVARAAICLPAFVHVLSDVQILNNFVHVSVGEFVIAIHRKKKKKLSSPGVDEKTRRDAFGPRSASEGGAFTAHA